MPKKDGWYLPAILTKISLPSCIRNTRMPSNLQLCNQKPTCLSCVLEPQMKFLTFATTDEASDNGSSPHATQQDSGKSCDSRRAVQQVHVCLLYALAKVLPAHCQVTLDYLCVLMIITIAFLVIVIMLAITIIICIAQDTVRTTTMLHKALLCKTLNVLMMHQHKAIQVCMACQWRP